MLGLICEAVAARTVPLAWVTAFPFGRLGTVVYPRVIDFQQHVP